MVSKLFLFGLITILLLFIFVNLIFISTFYLFFIWIIYNSKNFYYRLAVLSISLYGVLDNFGIEGGKNGYFDIDTIGKQDGAFAVLFSFLISLLLNK